MALFTSARDASLVSHLNRELLHKIISQQVAFYKHKLGETKTNVYGESSGEKFYDGPYLFFCLIDKKPQDYDHVEEGVSFNRTIEVAFYSDDLKDKELKIEIGDIILFEESYYEVAGNVQNQFFGGKNPEYPNSNTGEYENYVDGENPLQPGLENFGKSISIICKANYIPADKVGISPYKERM